MRRLRLLIYGVRSAHNVGSMLRTAEGLGLEKVYIGGYSPYPIYSGDKRLPHIAAAATKRIAKTALGAEQSIDWQPVANGVELILRLKSEGWLVCALEQTATAVDLTKFKPPANKVALVVGSEIGGLTADILEVCSKHLEIPMAGAKESFNVSVAAAMALYHLKYHV